MQPPVCCLQELQLPVGYAAPAAGGGRERGEAAGGGRGGGGGVGGGVARVDVDAVVEVFRFGGNVLICKIYYV